MKKLNSMSLALSSNQYHSGLSEIFLQFDGEQFDDYLSGLIGELANVNETLLGVMHLDKVHHNVKEENRQLNESLVSASRLITSYGYVADEAMKESAAVLKQLFDSYDKPFVRMKVDERVGAVSTLLRDLMKPAMQEHVARLPELSGRIGRIQDSLEALKVAMHEADKANSSLKSVPVMPLKREAADKVELLVDYLKAMAAKDPAAYADHYTVVMQIITRLNATKRRSSYLQLEVELDDDETTAETPQVAAGA